MNLVWFLTHSKLLSTTYFYYCYSIRDTKMNKTVCVLKELTIKWRTKKEK